MIHDKQSISIVGCGWLGLALGEFLAEKGFLVKGSTTTPSKLAVLQEKGIQPYLINFNPGIQAEHKVEFLDSQILCICLPPGVQKNGGDFHVQQIRSMLEYLNENQLTQLIYISSTSVYPELNKELDESLDLSLYSNEDINQTLIKAEELLSKFSKRIKPLILRCGGLMGYGRIPGKYFAGKTGLTTGEIPVNFIHRDDVIEIIYQLILQKNKGGVYNLVAPKHPIRRDVYLRNADEFQFQPPTFQETENFRFKLVSPDKIIKTLNYSFKYPDPLEFRYN